MSCAIRRRSARCIGDTPDAIDTAPIALDDDPAGKMETAELMVMLGIGLAGGGAVGALLMFLLPRRRRDEVVDAR